MDQVRIGVIGCGVIGRHHLKAAAESPRIDLLAVADLRGQVARDAAAEFGASRTYCSAEDLLGDADVQAVVLAMPTGSRSGVGLAALRAGKHVLLEKPPAMNIAEIDQMLAARGDCVVACASSRYRYNAAAQAAADLIARDVLGAVRLVRWRGIKPAGPAPEMLPPAWRLSRALNGGGILVNWGIYDLDYLLGLLGWRLRPRIVLAQQWPIPRALRSHVPPETDAETHVTALIRCENGAAITLERGEYMPAVGEDAWQIIGEEGSLRLAMLPGRRQILHDALTSDAGVQTRVVWSGEDDWQSAHAGPIRDFADAILDHRAPATSLENARQLQQIIDAVYASAERGAAVDIGAERAMGG